MAQDPTKVNPQNVPDKTYPGQGTGDYQLPRTVDLLPNIFRTDTNKKLLNAVMEDMFQPHALEDLNYAVGRKTTKTSFKEYLPHATARRQLETGIVYYKEAGVDTLSADEVAQGWGFNDRTNESPVPVSVLDLPIDPDKFVNWLDYHWLEEGMPVIILNANDDEGIDVINDIIGQKYYTSPLQSNGRRLEFKNGMRVMFQNFGNTQTINGDLDTELLTNGKAQIGIGVELNAYDSSKIGVGLNGTLQVLGVDYYIFGNSIFWIDAIPEAGQQLHLHFPDYYITTEADALIANRKWQIDGVGSKEGIRLLGRTYQYTNTVYSKATQTFWDQTAVPWDSIEWDGAVRGINAKHYILMQTGAPNRNAHSRVNVWYHKDAIQTLANYLGIGFNEIADPSTKALRPIVEFENNLELYAHGVRSRFWPNFAVKDAGIIPNDFINLPLKTSGIQLDAGYTSLIKKLKAKPDLLVTITRNDKVQYAVSKSAYSTADLADALANPGRKIIYEIVDNKIVWLVNPPAVDATVEISYKVKGVLLSKLRILWLQPSANINKIINIVSNSTHTISYIVELANNGDAVVVDVPDETDPFYLKEYYWTGGKAVAAQLRKSKTQQPLFELYGADQVKLSANPNHPQVINSKIISIVEGTNFDNESGYNLSFLPSQFNELTSDNTIRNAMYDIEYEHVQQTPAIYNNGTYTLTARGPYSFRRWKGLNVADELSHGYLRAWFRLRSWAIQTATVNNSSISLDTSVWPTYNWVATQQSGKLTILHPDNYAVVVNNTPVFGRGEVAKIEVAIPGINTITFSGHGLTSFDVDVVGGVAEFLMGTDVPGTLTMTIGSQSVVGRVVNAKFDPRAPQIKLNGLPTEYTYNITRDTVGYPTTIEVVISGAGEVEIKHQGIGSSTDHITAIPGLDYNTKQDNNLGKFTPSRLVGSMYANILSNKENSEQSWIDATHSVAFNGALMADHSSIRSAWASFKLAPTIQDIAVARANACWRWHRSFFAKLDYFYNLIDLTAQPVKDTVNRILEELLVGVNYSSSNAVSGMAFTTAAMNTASYVSDGMQLSYAINTGANSLYTGVYGPDHVYVYIENELVSKNNYTIDTATSSVVFNDTPQTGATIEIYHANEVSIYSGIPASPAKLGLSGLFEPKIVTETWSNNSKTFIQRHDGSRITILGDDENDIRNKIILELENRIYNGCLNSVGVANRQRQVNNFKNKPVSESQARAMIAWFSEHNIEYRDNTDYNGSDPWTWNYAGKSWRAIYLDNFGTYQLHEAPWEALGYDTAPAWWDTYYSWTDTNKRSALEYALKHGIISEPGQPTTIELSVRRQFDTFPVDASGNLQDPETWGVPAPTAEEAQQPWEIGSWSPAETVWARSPAGAWSGMLYAVDDYKVFNEYFDSAINPFVKNLNVNSTAQKGYGSIAPSEFYQTRPSIGIGSAIFEAYREFNLIGEEPLNELVGLSPRLQFAIGGYTDGDITLKMYYTKYQSGSYVPMEDFFVNLTNGVKEDLLRYSAVRIEKADTGFRVYGFDPGKRFFTIFTPTARSQTTSFPTSRKLVNTPQGTFTEYQEWNTTPATIPYGTYFENKQALYTFFQGLEEYQLSCGLMLDSINDRGTIDNWRQAAVDAFQWISENWGTEHHCVVGVATTDGLKISHTRGILDRLDADLGRTGKILFDNGRSALSGELLITRDYEENVDKVMPLNANQIVFAEFATRNYDHIVYVNPKTKFGDLIADFQTGNRIETLSISSRRTPLWNGRPHARGVLVEKSGLLPGFDALISDVKDSHKVELTGFDSYKNKIGKSNVVPAKATVINELIQDQDTAHAYRQGLQSAAGTNLAINALFRNEEIDIPGRTQDVNVNEEWLFDTGLFGNLKDDKLWEFEIRRDEITAPKQLIRLSEDIVDVLGDNIIDINIKDPRWVTQPSQPYVFEKINRANQTKLTDTKNWLPSAGVAELFETDLKLRDINSLNIEDLRTITKNSTDIFSVGNIFETNGFSRYQDYQPGDLSWQEGKLYKATARITGSSTSAFDSTQWEEVSLTGAHLPNVWVSDYGFDINMRFKGAWVSGTTYELADIIEKDGQYYTCVTGNNLEFTTDATIDDIVINDGGTGYAVGDTISLIEGTNTSAHGQVTAVDQGGTITAVSLTASGTGYKSKPSISIQSTNGQGAILNVVVIKYWEVKTSGYGWNILQVFNPMYVEETCPNALNTGLNESKVSFANAHGLKENDIFVLCGGNDGSVDRVHRVKAVVDDYNVLIAARTTSNTIVYNMVAFKLLPVKFDTLAGFNDSKIHYNWKVGMKAYIDKEGEGENYNYNFEIIEIIEDINNPYNVQYLPVPSATTMINNAGIIKAELVDYDTEEVIAQLEVYDPYKGLTIDRVAKYIDYKLPVDPAAYNVNELGNADEYVSEPWGKSKLNKLWWDLNKVRYIEYEQGTLEYRYENWGKQFTDSEVAIYEWTSSTELPTTETPGIRLDYSSGTGQVRYSVIQEINDFGAVVPTYYYWVRGSTNMPNESTRTESAAAIENILNNPDDNGVAWIAMIQNDLLTGSIVVSNINDFMYGRDRAILRIAQNSKPEQKHSTGVLLAEGMTGSIVPENLYLRLRDSLVGSDQRRTIEPIRTFHAGQNYAPGELISYYDLPTVDYTATSSYGTFDIPYLPTVVSNREDVTRVWQNNPADPKFGVFTVLRQITNATSWDDIHLKIKRLPVAVTGGILEDTRYYGVVESPRRVPDISLHPKRRYGNGIVPKPQSWFSNLTEARRNFITAVNDYLLSVDVISKANWDKYLRMYTSLLGSAQIPIDPETNKGTGKFYLWDYADYNTGDVLPINSPVKLNSINDLDSYPTATNFSIVDNKGVIQQVYDRDLATGELTLTYRKNGTIQFAPIWDAEGWDTKAWDSNRWDFSYDDLFKIVLKALRENIFVGDQVGYFNLTFFDMVKASLVQNPTADWVTKTTYLGIEQTTSNDLNPVAVYYDKKDALIKQYINEVKPYHSKVIDDGTLSKSTQTIGVDLGETLELTITDIPILVSEPLSPVLIDRRRNGTPETEMRSPWITTESGDVITLDGLTTIVDQIISEEG